MGCEFSPGQETKIPHAAQCRQSIFKEREKKCLFNKICRNSVGTVEGMAAPTLPAEIHIVAMGLTAKWQFPSPQLRAEDLTGVGGPAVEPDAHPNLCPLGRSRGERPQAVSPPLHSPVLCKSYCNGLGAKGQLRFLPSSWGRKAILGQPSSRWASADPIFLSLCCQTPILREVTAA